MDRYDVLNVKNSLSAAIAELRDAARYTQGDTKLREVIKAEITRLLTLKKTLKLPKAPKKPKAAPYRGGGSWHGGRLPGGRMAPTPRSIRDEQW